MNAILNNLRGIGLIERDGLSLPADHTATGNSHKRDNVPGSYGRGSYAGHSTHTLDFSAQGSYGRGSYAGHSTSDIDSSAQGSYGRGSYAGHSTSDIDFGPQGSFASGA
jgi:hypothetical protein